jgi:hypothetical protein
MDGLDALIGCAGTWRGTNRLVVSADGPPDESPSVVTVTPVLDGWFVRLDQTWALEGSPQTGSLLIGYDADSEAATAHWIDTFHMGRKVMECTGVVANGTVDVLGGYAAPPGPDWGWRIQVSAHPARQLEIGMFNIDPDGREELAVQASYSPA